jgi:hypothetical protein
LQHRIGRRCARIGSVETLEKKRNATAEENVNRALPGITRAAPRSGGGRHEAMILTAVRGRRS